MDDDGLVNLLVTVILVAFWALSAFTKRRSPKPSGTQRPEAQPQTTDEPAPDVVGESGDPSSDAAMAQSYTEPLEHVSPSAEPQVLAEPSIRHGLEGLVRSIPEDLPTHAGLGLWATPSEPGGEEPGGILPEMDADRLRKAIVLSEILAEPVSMRPLDR